VIFVKGKPWVFEDLCVKGDTISDGDQDVDFYNRTLTWIDACSSVELFTRLEEMLHKGASYPLETGEGRDGCFDDTDIFLVYERDDLVYTIELFQAALELAH
jgi:hypothetical protein